VEAPELYPPSPPGPRLGTEVTHTYRLRVALVLASLALFLALYLGLLVGAGGALAWLVLRPTKLGVLGALLGSLDAMLLAFLLKNVFRRQAPRPDGRVEVTEQEQPHLFAFLRRLCDDAGSPFPASVYLGPEVNAAVFYRRSFLALFLPQKKSLLIGLGLVNALNVSELKAVLAHEFGHFAQSSMKLGQFVYVANQVVLDMVVARDAWDEWLSRWRNLDVRLSFPAWILTGLVWLIRKALTQLFKLVNFAALSLSRQMEFDADLHAVALTGSDALVSGLWKTERAGIAMESAWSTLGTLMAYRKFTGDVFHHQKAELSRLDDLLSQADPSPFVRSLRSPYRYGAAPHFEVGDDHAPSMWETHPSNRDREVNAKRAYIAQSPVETPAIQLFAQRRSLKQAMTLAGYAMRFGQPVRPEQCLPAGEVETIAREEREEQRQAPHYHGLYESRFVDPGDLRALAAEVDALPPEGRAALREAALRWAGHPLAVFMKELSRLEADERALAAAIQKGDGKPLTLHDRMLAPKQTEALREEVRRRLAPLREQLRSADAAIFQHFYARTAGDAEARAELCERYGFLRAIEEHLHTLNGAEAILGEALAVLQHRNELGEADFRRVKSGLEEARARLRRVLDEARGQRVPRLSHLAENARVRDYILSEEIADPFDRDRLERRLIGELGRQLEITVARLRRLHFKNLGALLRLQERLDPEMYRGASP
jgi:Zn-dependent protease with chaperone function